MKVLSVESLSAGNGFHKDPSATSVHHSEVFNEKLANGDQVQSSKGVKTESHDDPAIFMLTSGSSGNAKAVCLRHGQFITGVLGKSKHHETTPDDTFLNWISMDHVANLSEIHLHAMSLGAEQVHVQAADLLERPSSFLSLLHKHHAAYTFAPNFFLAALRRQLEDNSGSASRARYFDLSSLKALISGGEANVVDMRCANP